MRSLQAQLQDIADWIAGLELDPEPTIEDFAEGALRAAWRAVHSRAWTEDPYSFKMACLAEMLPAMAGFPNGPALAERIKRVIPSTVKRPFRSLAEIAPDLRPVTWLWPSWLPVGMLTLLAARPGTGKSMIALDLAHRIISGQPWPDGAAPTRPGARVIYVDGENIPEVHNQRALAWNLQRELLYMLLPEEEDVLVDLSTFEYQERLAQMIFRLEPALVIIDSLGAVMGKGENAVEDVRNMLGFLTGLALHHSTSILLIHHLRKGNNTGQMALFENIDPDQIRGSGHITAMSRVAWGLTSIQTESKPNPNGPRKLQVIKSNLSRHPDALGIVLEPIPDSENVRVVYGLDAPESYKEPTAGDEAEAWLLGYLEDAGQPVKPADAVKAGLEEGFSRPMVFRAREALGSQIVNTGGRRNPNNKWALAATESPNDAEGEL